jgi:hypothetical protein
MVTGLRDHAGCGNRYDFTLFGRCFARGFGLVARRSAFVAYPPGLSPQEPFALT